MSDEMQTSGTVSGEGSPGAQGQVRLELDESGVDAIYANLCLVSSTAEEVILDLALNKNPGNDQTRRIRISHRVILSPYTAKRLAALLTANVQRHEAMFGPLETDIRKRLKPSQESAP